MSVDRTHDALAVNSPLETRKSEMQEELHTLGNCLARVKMGTRLLARPDVPQARRHELADEISDAIVDAESAFRLLTAQLK